MSVGKVRKCVRCNAPVRDDAHDAGHDEDDDDDIDTKSPRELCCTNTCAGIHSESAGWVRDGWGWPYRSWSN